MRMRRVELTLSSGRTETHWLEEGMVVEVRDITFEAYDPDDPTTRVSVSGVRSLRVSAEEDTQHVWVLSESSRQVKAERMPKIESKVVDGVTVIDREKK